MSEFSMQTIQIPRRDNMGVLYANLTKLPQKSSKIVIICHGFPGDKNEHGRFPYLAQKLAAEGIDSIAFDQAGFGDNVREVVTFQALLENMEDVFAWAKSQGYSQIGSLGLSIGGRITLLANLPDRRAAVFWAPAFFVKPLLNFSKTAMKIGVGLKSTKQILYPSAGENKEKIILTPHFIEEVAAYDIERGLSALKIPTLIMHGSTDLVVPISSSKKAIELISKEIPHELGIVKGAGHNFQGKKLEEFVTNTVQWFTKYL
jgi:pimeloyl-ACP methyl ester carboxylesterase